MALLWQLTFPLPLPVSQVRFGLASNPVLGSWREGSSDYFCRDHALTMSFRDNQLQLCNSMNLGYFSFLFSVLVPRNVKAFSSGSPHTSAPIIFEINRTFFFFLIEAIFSNIAIPHDFYDLQFVLTCQYLKGKPK